MLSTAEFVEGVAGRAQIARQALERRPELAQAGQAQAQPLSLADGAQADQHDEDSAENPHTGWGEPDRRHAAKGSGGETG